MDFLFIAWQVSHSLPPHGRSPSRSWPLVVLLIASSSFCSSMFVLFTGDLNPFWFQCMLRTHKAVVDNRLPAPSRNDPLDYNL